MTVVTELAPPARLLTTEELARLMKVDASTIRRWRTSVPAQGPPFMRLSTRVVKYDLDDVRAWLAHHRVDPEG
jgi:predicted DNA-binding transcriptional regulator AlpA